jgi:transposase
MVPGASVSGVARCYGIAPRVLFRWKQELVPPPPEPVFLSVTVRDGPDAVGTAPHQSAASMPEPVAAPVFVERPRDEIEVELVGGRRMRFARDTDPATVQAMLTMLEGRVP